MRHTSAMRALSDGPGAVFLAAAIVLEVAGTTSMKLSEGFTRLAPSIAMAVCYVGSLTMLTLALRTIALGTAYAIWAGIGTALVAAVVANFFLNVFALAEARRVLAHLATQAGSGDGPSQELSQVS
jgi:small multidrug resistance pump